MYLNSAYGETSSGPAIISSSWGTWTDNYFFDQFYDAQSRASVNLEADKYYYMEVYSVNTWENGWMKVNVEVPNSDTSLAWQAHDVNEFKTSLTNKP